MTLTTRRVQRTTTYVCIWFPYLDINLRNAQKETETFEYHVGQGHSLAQARMEREASTEESDSFSVDHSPTDWSQVLPP